MVINYYNMWKIFRSILIVVLCLKCNITIEDNYENVFEKSVTIYYICVISIRLYS